MSALYLPRQRCKFIHRNVVFAARRAEREQPLLDALQFGRIEIGSAQAPLRDGARVSSSAVSAASSAFTAGSTSAGRLRCAPLQPADRAPKAPAPANRCRRSRRGLRAGPRRPSPPASSRCAVRRARSPRRPAAQACQAPRPRGAASRASRLARSTSARCASAAACACAPRLPQRFDRRGVVLKPAEGIEQRGDASRHRPVRARRAGRGSRPARCRAACSTCTLTGWSLTKARVRPSASCTRRRISSSSRGDVVRREQARAPDASRATSNTAVTWPCSAPCRTSACVAAAARAPARKHRAGSTCRRRSRRSARPARRRNRCRAGRSGRCRGSKVGRAWRRWSGCRDGGCPAITP